MEKSRIPDGLRSSKTYEMLEAAGSTEGSWKLKRLIQDIYEKG
ncbi:MAG TPA: hypothetical protein VEF33_02465 [Syntrophales bacterium]|nr:hypothetical protein [Syntrophales bacterium]